MKLTAKIKLNPSHEQRHLLHETLQRANAASNYISELAWQEKTFNKLSLQKMYYYEVRDKFELSAQMVIRVLGKVAASYKSDKKTKHNFQKYGAFPYDSRILKYRLETEEVSIWTLAGRETIAFQAGQRQMKLLQHQQGESDLTFIRGEFYILAACDIDTPMPDKVADYMGVDVGVVNIATTDDGERYSGKTVNRVRHRYHRIRRKLQKKGTKSAKRLLKKRSGKEKRFANDVNHCVSKAIVKKAKRTERGVALEELTGILTRVRLRKPQRTQLHHWSFADLGSKIAYKADIYGVPLVYVDPRNTSRECAACGQVDKSNRKTQDRLLCIACGFSAHADVNAAVNIGRRGSVNAPYADTD
jgi:putative transposase